MKLNQLPSIIRIEIEKSFKEKLEKAQQLIKIWANRNTCVSCSFGKDSTVVLYLVREVNPQIPVVFCNTGVEFKETLEFKEFLEKEWNLNLIELRPEKTFWQIWNKTKELPDGSKKKYKKSVDKCCYYLKEKPFISAIKKFKWNVNFTGITAIESRQRMLRACEKGMEYYHKTQNILKVHPILYWTSQEVWDFIKDQNIPVNPAYEKYKIDRIGCVPCTAYKGWREQLARVNFRMYKYMMEHYFHQKLLEMEKPK